MLEPYSVDTEHVNGEGYYNQRMIDEQNKTDLIGWMVTIIGMALIAVGACFLALVLI